MIEAGIRVDGQEVARGDTQYNSTTFGLNVRQEWGPDRWGAYSGVINALASGSEAVWKPPLGRRSPSRLRVPRRSGPA